MRTLSNFFYSKSSATLGVVLIVLTFSYLCIFMIDLTKSFEVLYTNPQFLATSFGFDHELATEFFKVRSIEQIVGYKSFNLIWDNVFVLFYGVTYVVWLSFLFKPYSTKFGVFNLLPIVQMALDWLENYKLVAMSNSYLADSTLDVTDVLWASKFGMAKWVVSALIFAIIIVGVGLRIKRFMAIKSN